MTAQLIDGVAVSSRLRADVSARVQALGAKGITPGLAVILVGEDPECVSCTQRQRNG